MKNIVTCLLACIAFSTIAQNKPKDYYAFKGHKELIFLDDFDRDAGIWGDSTDNADEFIIKRGEYIYKSDSFDYSAMPCIVDIDFRRNFEIEFKAKIISNNDNEHTGVVFWGREDTLYNGHYFYFQDKNKHHIFYCNNSIEGISHPDVDKNIYARGVFNTDDLNLFTIRRYNKFYYIFINGIYSGKQKYIPLLGKRIGLGGSRNTTALFKYIKISYLP